MRIATRDPGVDAVFEWADWLEGATIPGAPSSACCRAAAFLLPQGADTPTTAIAAGPCAGLGTLTGWEQFCRFQPRASRRAPAGAIGCWKDRPSPWRREGGGFHPRSASAGETPAEATGPMTRGAGSVRERFPAGGPLGDGEVFLPVRSARRRGTRLLRSGRGGRRGVSVSA